MALRLMEIIVPQAHAPGVLELLADHPALGLWQESIAENHALIRVLLPTERTEVVSDVISNRFGNAEGFRIMLLAVEATLPRPEEPEKQADENGDEQGEKAKRGRISREELYTEVAKGAELTPVYAVNAALSALVAAIGLIRGDVAIIIGAMVIAPLLSPNIALALSATLGDLSLAAKAFKALAVALILALAVALLMGVLFHVSPDAREIAARTRVGFGDVILALAAGGVGTLAFTTGVPAALIGVMVAVALLPPLVTVGLLTGSGHLELALGAVLLFLINVTSLNLAATTTFLIQGVRPRTWWEAEAARKATRVAILLWSLMMLILLVLVLLWAHVQGGLPSAI